MAAFVAAGLEDRLERLTIDTDFADFLDEGAVGRLLGPLGNGLDVMLREGIYRGQVLHRWLQDTLAEAGVETWGDLRIPGTTSRTPIEHRYRLVVIVSDVSRGGCSGCRGTTSGCSASPRTACRWPTRSGRRPRSRSSSVPGGCRSTRRSPADAASSCSPTADALELPDDLFDDEPDHPTIGVKLPAGSSFRPAVA